MQVLGILILAGAAQAAPVDVRAIIQRSVAANEMDWKAAPNYAFVERDVEVKGGRQTTKTYQVLMIEGSQYNKVIAINDKPLSAAQQAQEAKKLQQEIAHRHGESSGARAKRVAKYNRERQQDRALLQEMANAFDFKLVGDQKFGCSTPRRERDISQRAATPRCSRACVASCGSTRKIISG